MIDKNLIFLISQPRSGSTLTQRILGTHSKIYTRSEPWIMLNSMYEFKKDGISAEYNKTWEYNAAQDFIDNLPDGGKHKYNEHLRTMHLALYDAYIKKEGKEFFLDKTPRYYLIIHELIELFPNAKYIMLLRNPLAVLGSIINSWTKDNWSELTKYKIDLIDGIDAILDGIEDYKDSVEVVYYEELLHDQTDIMKKTLTYIGLYFEEEILNYHQKSSEKWLYGDPVNVYQKTGIDSANDAKWTNDLKNLQYWRVMYDYLNYIGEIRYEKLGYNFSENLEILMRNMPTDTLDQLKEQTLPLLSFLDAENESIVKYQEVIKQKNIELQKVYSSKRWKLLNLFK